MINRKSWDEFKKSGFLWWINMMLHTFGWAIVCEYENNEIINVYPARVKFRGFSDNINTDGYVAVSEFMKENADELYKESKE